MKRILCLMITAALLCSFAPLSLAEKQPNPIPVIPEAELSPTPKGIHHYLLICIGRLNY